MSSSVTRVRGFGIDFGTTNSVVAFSERATPKPRTRALLTDDGRPHPSVVWYQLNRDPHVGRTAKTNLLALSEAAGNTFVQSIKRTLGKDRTFTVFDTKYRPTEIAAEIFRHLKADARQHHALELEAAVVTIPVEFDGRARRDLRMAADGAGIHIKAFVHEPFAATVGYCYSEKNPRTLEQRDGETILVFDWGGGTLDVTVARVEGATISELAAVGVSDRSGDCFDELLANFTKSRFFDRYQIPAEEASLSPGSRGRLRSESEQCKIDLSSSDEVQTTLGAFFRTNGRVLDLDERVTRDQFEHLIDADVRVAMAKVDEALAKAHLLSTDIDLALVIGGTSRIPKIRTEMHDRFGTKLKLVENADSIIAEGAAIVDALQLHPVLARPLCIELSDGAAYEIFGAGTLAKPGVCTRQVALFCTDNRDGQARLIVKEGGRGREAGLVTKLVLPIPVSPDLPKPYNHERVTAKFVMDEDLVLRVSAMAATQRQAAEGEIFDLCFALKSFGEA